MVRIAFKKKGFRPRRRVARKSKAVPKTFAKKVSAVLARREETKYVAEDIWASQAVFSSQATPASLYRMLPRLTQGTGDDQRIGDVIHPVRARSFIHYRLNATSNQFDATVNLIILQAKGAHTASAVAALPNDQLLKVGDGTNVDPTLASQVDMLTLVNHYPVNTEQYTVLKRIQFRISKGPGVINGAPGSASEGPNANMGLQQKVIQYNWKPPTLKYNVSTQNLPTNHYPVFITWATANDANALQGDMLNYTVRTELYYKDA